MRTIFVRVVTVPALTGMWLGGLSSCAPNGEVNPGASTGIGAALGAGLGYAIDDNNRGRGALIGGLLGAGAGYLFAKSYNASVQQRQQAQQVGQSYASKPSNAQHMKKSKARYVAVPVKSEKKSGAKDVVLYDTEKGTTDTKAYEPESGANFESGQVVTVGGKQAVVSNSFQGI